jgi:hypothetical protein
MLHLKKLDRLVIRPASKEFWTIRGQTGSDALGSRDQYESKLRWAGFAP